MSRIPRARAAADSSVTGIRLPPQITVSSARKHDARSTPVWSAANSNIRSRSAVEARSRDMVYEESARRIVYSGDVEIRQGDILTRSPEAVVTLAREGGGLDRMIAGEPVEVVQGARRATGERGTYTPADETFVLVGAKVVLQDVDRRLEGRILTFQVGGDRIRVDGREEGRTEAVFKRKEPSQP